jgi:hypothetical protein
MKFDSYKYRIGSHFLSAIVNGDYSGLEGSELANLAHFLRDMPHAGEGHWSLDSESDEFFGRCEINDQFGNVVDVEYLFPI